jgi:NADH-quinone oxidoreductase subunit N
LWIVALAGVVAAAAVLALRPPPGSLPELRYVIDETGRIFQLAILGLAGMTLALTTLSLRREHNGEYLALLLFSTIGLLMMIGATDLLFIFLAIELAGLPLYLLSAYNRRDAIAAEAGIKYFLFGAAASAFMLFGFSIIYGYAGTTALVVIAAVLGAHPLEPMLAAGIVMALAGFGFKVAAVPFHLWAPDTYQAAPLPSAAFIATGSKVAGFFLLAKFLLFGGAGRAGSGAWGALEAGWIPFVVVLALASMVLGNLGALAQRESVRRLLAYSAIAQGGYLLLGAAAFSQDGVRALCFYVLIYAVTLIGLFGVVGAVEARRGTDRPEAFAGLWRESPSLALCLLLFLISLAGIPPLAGFAGKFALFLAAVKSDGGGLLWIVAIAVALNAVSLYYYLLVLKQVFVRSDEETSTIAADSRKVPWPAALVIFAAAALVVLLGLLPELLLGVVAP